MALWGRRPYQVLVESHVTRVLTVAGFADVAFLHTGRIAALAMSTIAIARKP